MTRGGDLRRTRIGAIAAAAIGIAAAASPAPAAAASSSPPTSRTARGSSFARLAENQRGLGEPALTEVRRRPLDRQGPFWAVIICVMNAAAIDGYEEALRRSGVTWTTLTADEKDALDRHGFVVLAGVLDAAALARLRDAFEAAARSESAAPGGKQTGTRHPEDLLARAPAFDLLVAHPKVLAAVRHVLRRPFRIFLFAGRDPLPGFGLQGLHADWLPRTTDSDPYGVVSAIWALDDFTERNGATRVVPGSHRLPRPIPKSMQDPAARHPEQKVVVAKAGSVLVLNGHLWHSGRRNDGDGPRRAVQCQYVARDHVRPGSASIELPGRLPAEARRVLGG